MIAFWNRREVFMGFDIGDLAQVRDTLAAAGIRYTYRSTGHNLSTAFRGHIGSYGENPMQANVYYVYVHKDDFDKAQSVLHPFRRD